jgi:hypothetical protein
VENTDIGIHRLITAWWTATNATASRNGVQFWYSATTASST